MPVPTYWEKKSLVYQKCYPGIGINIEAKHKNKKIPFLFGKITTGAESRSRPKTAGLFAGAVPAGRWSMFIYILFLSPGVAHGLEHGGREGDPAAGKMVAGPASSYNRRIILVSYAC